MSGQRSSSSGGTAASVAAGCSMRENSRVTHAASFGAGGLAVFSWGRGEDGQLGSKFIYFTLCT